MTSGRIALNSLLPDDIICSISVEKADQLIFMLVLMRVGKNIAISCIYQQKRDPFQRNYAYQYPYPLNLEAMRESKSTIYLVPMILLVFVLQKQK